MLAPVGEDDLAAPDDSLWNGRLVFSMQGGVAIGRIQRAACSRIDRFEIYSSSRRQAGGPFRGGVFKCEPQSVSQAIAAGLYGSWTPTAGEQARLQQIFPSGVCDFSRPDVGRPVG
jgi:hypothetical protein